jgi:hypothetical protein
MFLLPIGYEAMSKQSEAKVFQGYVVKPKKNCANCVSYRSDFIQRSWIRHKSYDEKNKLCSIGGFAVQKTATCDLWAGKP